MVKLLRLTTENDAKFSADLDAGIDVGERGQIAVQNLTFETDYKLLKISGEQTAVRVTWDTNAGTIPLDGYLPHKTYSLSNYQELWEDLQGALNMTQEVDTTNVIQANKNYGEFRVRIDPNSNKTDIEYKLSPLCLPFHQNVDSEPRKVGSTQIFGISLVENGDDSVSSLELSDVDTDGGINLGNLTQPTATTAETDDLSNYIFPVDECGCLSRGCGIFFCNINNLVDNTGAADTNGFGIGLSFTDIGNVTAGGFHTAIPTSARDFEIRCKRPADDFTYFTPTNPGVAQTSTGNAPYKYDISVDINPAEHDLIMLERIDNRIVGSVCDINAGGGGAGNAGNKRQIFNYSMTLDEQKKKLFPYIYVCGGRANATVGHPVLTPLVLSDNNMAYETTGETQTLYITGSGAPKRNAFELYSQTNARYTSVLANSLTDEQFEGNTYSTTQNMKLQIWGDILHQMGYVVPRAVEKVYEKPDTFISISHINVCGYTIKSPNTIGISISDNYIVMIDSNPVISYDASKFNYDKAAIPVKGQNHRGRQKNILATIPVNNNTNGLVEFQANELVYIDLDNKFPQTIKNLRLRVLNKRFEEILTIGTSVLTLLIKS